MKMNHGQSMDVDACVGQRCDLFDNMNRPAHVQPTQKKVRSSNATEALGHTTHSPTTPPRPPPRSPIHTKTQGDETEQRVCVRLISLPLVRYSQHHGSQCASLSRWASSSCGWWCWCCWSGWSWGQHTATWNSWPTVLPCLPRAPAALIPSLCIVC